MLKYNKHFTHQDIYLAIAIYIIALLIFTFPQYTLADVSQNHNRGSTQSGILSKQCLIKSSGQIMDHVTPGLNLPKPYSTQSRYSYDSQRNEIKVTATFDVIGSSSLGSSSQSGSDNTQQNYKNDQSITKEYRAKLNAPCRLGPISEIK